MSTVEEVSPGQCLRSRAALVPLASERLEHIRIFAELAAVGIGPSNLPFVPGPSTRRFGQVRALQVVPTPPPAGQLSG